jgi:kynurenine formamidase
MRRLIDLSMPVRTGHFRWEVQRRLAKAHDTGAGQATWAGWNVHAFTHMDSPRHVDPNGFTTDAVSLDMTVGEAAVLDLSGIEPNTPIEGGRIAAAAAHLRPGDIAVIKTCWGEYRSIDTPEFWLDSPWMTDSAAEFLFARKVRAVAFDFPQDHCIRYFLTGQQRPPLSDHVTHYRLLARGVIMFEYLANTVALRRPRNLFVGLPISLPDSDGSPARIIAIEEDAA